MLQVRAEHCGEEVVAEIVMRLGTSPSWRLSSLRMFPLALFAASLAAPLWTAAAKRPSLSFTASGSAGPAAASVATIASATRTLLPKR